MNYSFDIHHNEGLDNLFENSQDFVDWNVFLLFVVIEKVAFRAVLHGNLKQLVGLIELRFVDFN